MKKLIFAVLIMFGVSNAYTQDLIKEIQKLTLANDSLQKQVINPLNDSISKLNSAHINEISKLNAQLKTSENEKKDLNKKIQTLESSVAELNKNKIKVERDNLTAKCDSLIIQVEELKNLISAKENQIAREKDLYLQKSIQEKEKGKQEVLSQIIQTYNNKSFDELIKNSTLKTVDRDISIIGDKIEVKQKLLSLQKYFNSELVLSEKYREQKVENAINQLKSIEQTEYVLKLNDMLSKYKLCNDGLINTIDKILQIDKRFIANDEYTQKTKLNEILAEIAWYFRNYRFNFIDYPYLNERIIRLIKEKQVDANKDISAILQEL